MLETQDFTSLQRKEKMIFEFGSLTISYYALSIVFGIIAGYFLVLKRRKLYKISTDEIETLVIILIPAAIIGARIYHVIAEWWYYKDHLDEILSLKLNGLGLFGGLIAAGLVLLAYCYWSRINSKCSKFCTSLLQYLNLVAPALLLGQAIGRLGNFFNQELYGPPTNLPWGIYINRENRIRGYYNLEYFHPVFLYEMIWNFIGVGLMLWVEKKRYTQHYPLIVIYLIWYGLGRFLIGFIRVESSDFWILNDGQVMALLFVFAGLIPLIKTELKQILKRT